MKSLEKFKYVRSQKHLGLIRSMPCCACGTDQGVQAAHSNQGKHGKAMSKKASDSFTLPLCLTHHQAFDQARLGAEYLCGKTPEQWFNGHLKMMANDLYGDHLMGWKVLDENVFKQWAEFGII